MKWSLLLLITTQVFAYDPYQIRSANESAVCDNTYIELENSPPLRDQGIIGICYAYSSLLLLEHLKCSEEINPTHCYENNRASTVDMAKHYKGKGEISVGGDPRIVLTRFAAEKKLVNEACTSMNGWKELGYLPEFEDFFHQVHSSILKGANEFDVQCFAEDLSAAQMGEVSDLIKILKKAKSLSVGQLRTEVLYKKNCNAPSVTFPAYDIHTYPNWNERKTNQGILNFVKRNLDIKTPLEVSFCAEKDSEGNCYYHSTTITGMRNVCSQSHCDVQYKIQNSYGKSWQDNHDNGWVSSKLINESIISTPGLYLNSITKAGKSLPSSASYKAHTSNPNMQGICANGSSNTSINYAPSTKSEIPGIFHCKDSNGRSHFSDKPLSGMFCKAQ